MKIFIRAKTGAKNPYVQEIDAAHFVVAVRERPTGGEANDAIERALAEYFGVAPSCVRIVSGFTSREKTAEIA